MLGTTEIDWNVYSKIQRLIKLNNNITYPYDTTGSRINKKAGGKKPYYLGDAGAFEKAVSLKLL